MDIKVSDESQSSTVTYLGMLNVLFIGLKLGGVIAWSWWWVMSPVWLPIAVVLAFFLLILIIDMLR